MELTGETVQIIGMGLGGFVIAVGTWWGTKKSDGKPPQDRAPAPHEVREALAELRRLIDNLRDDHDRHDDDHRQMTRQLDRIENRLQISNEVRHWNEVTQVPGRSR